MLKYQINLIKYIFLRHMSTGQINKWALKLKKTCRHSSRLRLYARAFTANRLQSLNRQKHLPGLAEAKGNAGVNMCSCLWRVGEKVYPKSTSLCMQQLKRASQSWSWHLRDLQILKSLVRMMVNAAKFSKVNLLLSQTEAWVRATGADWNCQAKAALQMSPQHTALSFPELQLSPEDQPSSSCRQKWFTSL